MSRYRVGRLMVLGYTGTKPPSDLFRFAERFGLGGVILFGRNCPDSATVRRAILTLRRGLAQVDREGQALVMVDQEGGRVERIQDGVPSLPSAYELGKGGAEDVEDRVLQQAESLASIGLDVNLAPVCDVVQCGESGAIGDRAFGTDPVFVARLAASHVRACLAGGVLPCAKHFPGHGAARTDSHHALPIIEKSLEDFCGFDLLPFGAAIQAGVPLVMAGHLLCPAISHQPASLSRPWIEEVLRGSLEFGGVVISDDMEMGALQCLGEPSELALQALESGCDMIILGRVLKPDLDIWGVAELLERRLSGRRYSEAFDRIAAIWGAGE